jgi:hypothetical protein
MLNVARCYSFCCTRFAKFETVADLPSATVLILSALDQPQIRSTFRIGDTHNEFRFGRLQVAPDVSTGDKGFPYLPTVTVKSQLCGHFSLLEQL